MTFTPRILLWDGATDDAEALCAQVVPACWTIEAAIPPPPAHDPVMLLGHDDPSAGAALSVASATALVSGLGPALVDRLGQLGIIVTPLGGLALHELIVNAVCHGNLRVALEPVNSWSGLVARQAALATALEDPALAARAVTIALGWN